MNSIIFAPQTNRRTEDIEPYGTDEQVFLKTYGTDGQRFLKTYGTGVIKTYGTDEQNL
jgi:hypothetical protein